VYKPLQPPLPVATNLHSGEFSGKLLKKEKSKEAKDAHKKEAQVSHKTNKNCP
jgi:hypothetical protein